MRLIEHERINDAALLQGLQDKDSPSQERLSHEYVERFDSKLRTVDFTNPARDLCWTNGYGGNGRVLQVYGMWAQRYEVMMEHWTKQLRRRLTVIQTVEREFYNYLTGPKFQGACEDYISVHEVLSWLDRIGAATLGENTYGDFPDDD